MYVSQLSVNISSYTKKYYLKNNKAQSKKQTKIPQ